MKNSIDRREFMKVLAGAGALVATSQLPAIAAEPAKTGPQEPQTPDERGMLSDDWSVFPERTERERLSLSFAVVKIGIPEPFSVLHVTDTHFTAAYPDEGEKKLTLHKQRTRTFGGHQEEAFRDTLAWAKQHCDYIVHTGDLIDWQSRANFDLVRKYYGDTVFGCVGNHEFTPDMWLSDPKESRDEQFKDLTREKLQEVYPFNIKYLSQVVNGVNFITLDNVYGYVTQEQVDFFKEQAKRCLPIVLCSHVPYHTEESWRVSTRFWDEKTPYRNTTVPAPGSDYKAQQEDPVTREFIAYLKTEPLLKAMLVGHEHFNFQTQFSPTCVEYMTAANFLFAAREVLFI